MATGLATRCTACGTVFRVVPDQLRVSEGWVRCGRCSEVFNAAAALLDLETGLPRPAPEDYGSGRIPSPPPSPPPARPAVPAYRDDDRLLEPPPAPPPPPPVPMPVMDDSASRFAASALAEDSHPAPADPHAEPEDKPLPAPSFVRQAERAARWRSRPVRALLWLLALLGTAGLGAQVLHEYRDLAAARHPALRPTLEAACHTLGCEVGAARSINDVTVESSGLVRVEKSTIYKLSVALRNRAGFDVALPSLELSLTDAQGQLVARRVLKPADLGVNPATVPAGRELSLQATLQAATAPVAGYTLELFYP
ncbi:MAG: zinc-ribbon and DUF3426 domain-containing protein [Rubrivivax sp.]|nr:zinc-ribbon and DUF3426 domain-containing protein [Rubrivivax sp.]